MALQLVKALKSQISPLVAKAENHGEKQIASIQEKALSSMKEKLTLELAAINRLKSD